MRGRTHIVAGAVAWVAFAGASGGHYSAWSPVLMGSAVIGSLLPDIDHPGSVIGKKILPVSLLLSGIFGHRGITHSLLAVIGLTVGIILLMKENPGGIDGAAIAVAAATGYLSHLLLDWLTPSGIPLLYPAQRMFRAPVTIQTGGAGEVLFAVVILLTMLANLPMS